MPSLVQEFEAFVKGKHPTFEFRPQQKDVIVDILEAYEADHNGVYLLDAPTGSGKSVIAMLFADFMSHKGNRGYILASDLALHEQYTKDFRAMQLWNWGNIKGVDNYECSVNGERFSVGDCKSKGLSYEAAEALPCFKHCGYLTARKKAIKAPVALLTYPYSLIQRNYVEQQQQGKGKGSPFPQRDFVVCDEAHKLLEIVQSHFSPIVSHDIHKKTEKFLEDLVELGLKSPNVNLSGLKGSVVGIYNDEDPGKILAHIANVVLILGRLMKDTAEIREYAAREFGEDSVPKDWLLLFNLSDWLKDVHCKLEDYVEIINQTGHEKMVKNPGENSITFNCIDEYYLLQKHFFNKFGFKLMMTATMGSAKDFMKNHGIKSAKYFKMDSHFRWDRSPVIFYPGKKLSARFLNDNLAWAVERVISILDAHKEESGIIHSGSYELGQKIWAALPKTYRKRVLLYKGSEEKDRMLKKMKKTRGLVAMGPSLLEGLNLVDDLSRFQIFLKVPYPHLGDKYVAAKLAHSQAWYSWKTSISVLQGVGRSIRTPNDWAVTYLIDGCFADLFKSAGDQFPADFRSRLKIEYK
jgi:ATP-dependent DNA helicase DinG